MRGPDGRFLSVSGDSDGSSSKGSDTASWSDEASAQLPLQAHVYAARTTNAETDQPWICVYSKPSNLVPERCTPALLISECFVSSAFT